ncbi:MAG: siderophore-interacting protein [Streptomycetaceae bacterium]|nr:siderophore-interacting protein [Streptomycetaceae bacterium]
MAHTEQQADGQTATPADEPRPKKERGLRGRVLDRLFVSGRIAERERISARMTRIRVAGPGLRAVRGEPGQQVRVLVGGTDADSFLGRRVGELRTYSVWQFGEPDADAGTLDLCVMDHAGDGPGARWARSARIGDLVRFRGPEGSLTLRPDAPYHVFVGEDTASVALGAMLRAVPAQVPVFGAVETAREEDRLPLSRAGELARPLRGDAPAAGSTTLLDAVRGLELPDEPGTAYVAGEARTIQLVRSHLVEERGWPRRSVVTKPFWTPGKKGME